jgi:S-DNA-T family DNA segregation ATPase FtsK/SpoIIIE
MLEDVGEADEPGVPAGIEEFGLKPVAIDLFGAEPHFLVFGDGECGKTNLLRVLTGGLGSHAPTPVEIHIVDYRRSLADVAEMPGVEGYAVTPAMAQDLSSRLAGELQSRLPSPDLSPADLAAAQWWEGPHVVVVVDDYDLLPGPLGNPLDPLLDLFAQGRDVGLHLVLARRVGGLARSSYEPVLQRIRELGTPGLLMDGDPAEGPVLGGHKALPLPPGRGVLVRRRRRTMLVQTALAPRFTTPHPR